MRWSNGDLGFIECGLPNGVEIIKWNTFCEHAYYKNFQKIVYRKLVMDRSYEKMKDLEKFIKAAMKKKYKLNPSKLLRKYNDQDYQESIKNSKTYFCSELAASIYKNLGLLPHNISAS